MNYRNLKLLFCLVVSLSLLLFSCQTNDKEIIENDKLSYLETIGKEHNELLIEFLENNKTNNFKNTKSLVRSFYEFSIKNNPELKDYEEFYNKQLEGFNVGLKTSEIYANFKVELNVLSNNKHISQYMRDNLLSIVKNPTLEHTYDVIHKMQRNPNLTIDEKNSLKAFVNVLEASKDLWQNSKFALTSKGLDPSEKAMIGDALGGALWWWTGPAAALIAGGYSLALYNA
ncbi:hypothetical protein [uncultured Tenacibaculum sp.]|uniref:hypothetical protein n=1 Tax=uncultured Tenacibaculum sp. TaxID=174713 RepID=UPI002607FC8F|nr:hypothetical protein [uncultured Tenacibaculum sp.]